MFGLSEKVVENLKTVFAENAKIDKAIVFGSRAKGNYKEGSDIDITIKGQNLDFDDTLSLLRKIDDLNIPYKIDLINYHSINEPDLKDHIDRVGIEFYSRWKECKLGDICSKIGSGATPTGGGQAYKASGISLIRSQNVLDFKFGYDGLAFIDDEQAFALKNVTVQERDILLNITGDSVARVCEVPQEVLPARVNQHVAILRAKKDVLNNDFLLYQLQAKKESLLILSEIGGTRNALTKVMIEDFEVNLPPLPEQTAIASILSSLDDKIDLLHRQNKTLEQLAETLFRQWFVEEAEESWEEVALSEIAVHSKENVHPSKNPTKIYKHYSLPSFDAGKEPINEIGKEILSNKYKVISNSILVSKLNPRTPRIWMIYGNVNEDECICSTEFQIVKPKNQKWYSFIYCFLKSNQVTQELAGASSGTSGSHQRVNPQDIFNLTFLKPTDILIEEFSKLMDNYWVKINNNQTQIRTLTQTRDTLLPKLMSGEIRLNYDSSDSGDYYDSVNKKSEKSNQSKKS